MPKTTKTTKRNANKVVAAEAKAKGAQVTLIRKLAPSATKINRELAKAEKFAGQALDARLAACMELGKVKVECKANGLNFKAWCTDNIEKSYETIRKLANFGEAGDETVARQRLTDLRERTKAAQAKVRENSASKPTTREPVTHAKPSVTPEQRALEALDALSDEQRLATVKELAPKVGVKLSTQVSRFGEPDVGSVKDDVMKLSSVDRVKVLEWLADTCGRELVQAKPIKPISDDDLLAIPAKLQRTPRNPNGTIKAKGKAKGKAKRASAK